MNPHHLDHPLLIKSLSAGIKLGLENILSALKIFGDPHKQFPSVHIAGTNGKGSTAFMVSSCLIQSGYKTGLFTSPHLLCMNERFQINNRPLPKKSLLSLLDEIQSVLSHRKGKVSLTYFELCTLIAFVAFQRAGVEFVIVETGMGGRLDSTNVLKSKHVIITSIGFDHEKHLGKTLKKIAGEKAGIIHGRANVILGKMLPSVGQAVCESSSHRAVFSRYGSDFCSVYKKDKLVYESKGIFNGIEYSLALNGKHQVENSALVIRQMELLSENGYSAITSKTINRALKKVFWKGRFHIIHKDPILLFDAAHNISGVQTLKLTVLEKFPDKKMGCVCGFCKDKRFDSMIEVLMSFCSRLVLVPLKSERSFDPKMVRQNPNFSGRKMFIKAGFNDAMEAFKKCSLDGIVVCGSFYLLEEAYKWWSRNKRDYFADCAKS